MKQLKFYIVTLALVVLASCGKKTQSEQVVQQKEYPVMIMSTQNATMQSIFPATIKGEEDIEIRPRVEGFIKNIYVDEGSVVKTGQALFEIDSPASEQALTTALAAVNSAKAKVNTAELDVERYRPLAEKGIVSQVQLKTCQNAYESAVAALEQAEASLKNAQANMSWTKVSSPVNGVMGTVNFRTGSLVNSGSILTTISNTSNVYAYFSLNEKKLMELLSSTEGSTQSEKIKNIPPVTLVLADGTEYEEPGRVETITGTVNVTTGSANFRAEFPNRSGKLRSGASAKVTMYHTLKDVFVIPQKCTFKQQDKVLVYKLGDDNITEQVIISVQVMPNGKEYAVTEGLSVGDKIVADGVATLRNGTKIAVKNN